MASEFSTLIDLLQARGYKYSEIIPRLHTAILNRFYELYPQHTDSATVHIDTATGEVKLFADAKDITPSEFADEAASLARLTLIQGLQKSAHIVKSSKDYSSLFYSLTKLVFWGYNSLFLLGIAFFVFGLFNPSLRDTWRLQIDSSGYFRLFLTGLLVLTPPVTVWYTLKHSLSQRPADLAKLFFLFEVPTLVLLYFFTAAGFQLVPIVSLFVIALVTTPAALYLRDSDQPSILKFLLYEVLTGVSGYLSLLFAFFVPIIIAGTISLWADQFFPHYPELLDVGRPSPYYPSYYNPLSQIWWLLIGIVLSIITALAITTPYLVVYNFVLSFTRARTALLAKHTAKFINQLTVGSAAILLVAFFALSYQSAIHPKLKMLLDYSRATTFAESEDLAEHLLPAESLKETILDIANYRRRYLFSKSDTSLGYAYKNLLNLDSSTSDFVQSTFLALAYPFVYQGTTDDYAVYATAYQQLTGKSLYQKDHIPYIAPPQVILDTQNISATTSSTGTLATVVIDETYHTTSSRAQEVIYEFSLPPDATIFDLKLGTNLEFPGVIAPKGAARQVYEREVRKAQDPALLEQIGLRQYRMRIFPIPANSTPQRVQFSYVVGLTSTQVPLPVYSTSPGLFVHKTTPKFTLNGQPKANLTLSSNPCALATSASVCPPDLSSIAASQVAILYDVSASNASYDIQSKLIAIPTSFFATNKVDFYRYNTRLSAPVQLTSANLPSFTYFGASDPTVALTLLTTRYDKVIIFVTDSSFAQIPTLTSPTYLIYTSGTIPNHSQLFTHKLLSSGGSIIDHISDAFIDRSVIATAAAPYWSARAQFNQLLADLHSVPTQAWLDEQHQFAVASHIVTPYSSLIALVNDQQRQDLDQAAQNYDRYADAPAKPSPMIDAINLESRGPSMPSLFDLAPLGSSSNDIMFNRGGPYGGISAGGVGYSPLSMGSSSPVIVFAIVSAFIFLVGFVLFLFKSTRKA